MEASEMVPTPPQTIGVLLRRYRIAAGLTQEALAARSGVSVYSISNLERDVGHTPRKDTLALLADALGLSVDQRAVLQVAAVRLRTSHAAMTPTAAAAIRKTPPYHVPTPPTRLIGRENELAALGALLRGQADDYEAGSRLVTFCGPPGVGKTRLALEVVRRQERGFPDGGVFVSLAPLTDPALVEVAIAHALGITDKPGAGSPREQHMAALGGKQLLLLLDNFEHLLSAAPLVSELLAAAPGLHIIATSRAPLHVQGEQEYPVTPLALPDATQAHSSPEELAAVPAVALFIERARAVRPGWTPSAGELEHVAAVCRQLDGLPLAIELAATRMKVLSAQALLQRLEHRLHVLTAGPVDLPARQQTLRATLAWSHDLLSAGARALFGRVSIFSGTMSFEAIEALSRAFQDHESEDQASEVDPEQEQQLLDAVTELVDNSLLASNPSPMPNQAVPDLRDVGDLPEKPRFAMLQTVREYALEQLARSGEAHRAGQAFVAYYRALAEQAQSELRGPRQMAWFIRLEQEHTNLRAAILWAAEHDESQTALALGASLWRYWYTRGHLHEGAELLERVLDLPWDDADEQSRRLRGRALNGASDLALRLGAIPRATALIHESLSLFRAFADRDGIAAAVSTLGGILHDSGDLGGAVACWEESLQLRTAQGKSSSVAGALYNLSIAHFELGQWAIGTRRAQESLALRRALGDTRGVVTSLFSCGDFARAHGDYTHARELLDEAANHCRTLGYPHGLAIALNMLSDVACDEEDYPRAVALCDESLQLFRDLDEPWFLAKALTTRARIARYQEQLAHAAALVEEAATLRRSLGDQINLCETLVEQGLLAYERGEAGRAQALLQESLRLARHTGARPFVLAGLDGMALILSEQQPSLAAQVLAAASAMRAEMEYPRPPCDEMRVERTRAQLRASLGPAALSSALQAGTDTDRDRALDEILMLEQANARAEQLEGINMPVAHPRGRV
jgi:predicted ATPase/DNA-binding XRE family transcriptional regulator